MIAGRVGPAAIAAVIALAATGCASPPRLRVSHDLDGPVRMVVSERWSHRARLVVVDETGDRLAPLLTAAAARDEHPRFSPDAAWLVFASDRDRDDGGRSLWVAATWPGAVPRRLTDGPATDLDPVWEPDGRAIVFASDRAGGLDLFRLAIAIAGDGPRADGEPERLTSVPGRALSPTVAGGRLVFQVIDAPGAGGPEGRVGAGRAGRGSYVAERRADGTVIDLTDGPTDGSPALSPDGSRLAYVTARLRADGGRDLDVVLAGDPDSARPPPSTGLELEATDEGSPAWSVDGRWLFATSVAYDTDDQPALVSVIHVDTWERPARARMLRDSAGAIPRQGPALAPVILDAAALGRNPGYGEALIDAWRALEAERQAETGAATRPDL